MQTNTSHTLTERYIATTVKTLPPAMQGDVRAELAASIADAAEARVEQGESLADAERSVLTELGDPAALAAGYADRPLHLIGPRYYLTWWRLLKLLLLIVPVCAAGGVALGQMLADAPIGAAIGQTVAVGVSTAVHLCVWVTLVFVALERSGAGTGTRWSPDQLPEAAPTGTGRADLIASLVLLGIAVGAVVWDHFPGLARIDDIMVHVLNPQLWPWTITALFALIAAEAALAVAVYARGRWTQTLAIVNTALGVLFVSGALTLLARGHLINPDFIRLVLLENDVTPDTVRILGVLLGFGILGISVWDVIDGWLKRRRDARD